MKNLIFVAILWIASLTFAHAFDTQNIIMAVSEFTVATPKVTKADAATMATLLETPFVQSGIVDVVEREKIGLVYRNLNLVPGQLIDQATAVKVGKLLQTNYLLLGEIKELFGSLYFSARLVNVETGKIDSKYDFNLNPNGNVVADLGELAGKILIDIKAAGLKFDAPSYPFKLGPLSVSGHHNLPTQSKVWLLLHDGKLYYLQNARLNLESSGNWTNHGVNVGHGIKSIHAVLVTDEGDLLFQQKIANSDYSGFSILPAGSRELDSANLIQQ